MIRICIVILALFVSLQSVYARSLSDEEVVDVIKNGDVLLSYNLDTKIGGISFYILLVWYRMNGIIYRCYSSDVKQSVIGTNCIDSRKLVIADE